MVYCSQIIKRACDLAGSSDLISDSIDGNEFGPLFTKLQDILSSMNNDPQIIFGYNTLENIDCKGYNTVYFKPLTAEEIETSATNFDDNRLFYEIPSTPPNVIINGCELDQMIHSQLIAIRGGSNPMFYSFNREYDKAVVSFDGPANTVTFVYPKSIEIPEAPEDELKVPGQFVNFIVAALALEICLIEGMKESIGTISAKMDAERAKVKSNNQLNRQEAFILVNPRRFEGR